jgi:hypothetical protein
MSYLISVIIMIKFIGNHKKSSSSQKSQSYVDVSTSAVLKETGWSSALLKRLISTGAASIN